MVTDQSSVKSTAKIPIFNEFLNTFLEIQILRYFIGNSNYIHNYHKFFKLNSKHYLVFSRECKVET